jgi:hypothetical protein
VHFSGVHSRARSVSEAELLLDAEQLVLGHETTFGKAQRAKFSRSK